MLTLVLVATAAIAAAGVSFTMARRKPDAPTAANFATPQQLDRDDFAADPAAWLLVLFTSQTCLSCLDARESLASIELTQVVLLEVDVETEKVLHERYAIDAVPTVVLADHDGVVRWSYLGAPSPAVVSDALVELGAIDGDEGTAVSL